MKTHHITVKRYDGELFNITSPTLSQNKDFLTVDKKRGLVHLNVDKIKNTKHNMTKFWKMLIETIEKGEDTLQITTEIEEIQKEQRNNKIKDLKNEIDSLNKVIEKLQNNKEDIFDFVLFLKSKDTLIAQNSLESLYYEYKGRITYGQTNFRTVTN